MIPVLTSSHVTMHKLHDVHKSTYTNELHTLESRVAGGGGGGWVILTDREKKKKIDKEGRVPETYVASFHSVVRSYINFLNTILNYLENFLRFYPSF